MSPEVFTYISAFSIRHDWNCYIFVFILQDTMEESRHDQRHEVRNGEENDDQRCCQKIQRPLQVPLVINEGLNLAMGLNISSAIGINTGSYLSRQVVFRYNVSLLKAQTEA